MPRPAPVITAQLTIDAYPEKKFDGLVTEIQTFWPSKVTTDELRGAGGQQRAAEDGAADGVPEAAEDAIQTGLRILRVKPEGISGRPASDLLSMLLAARDDVLVPWSMIVATAVAAVATMKRRAPGLHRWASCRWWCRRWWCSPGRSSGSG